jgi:hypothetical protein
MATKIKSLRDMSVSFTKINEDVIVPTWRAELNEKIKFWDYKAVWGVLFLLWLVGVISGKFGIYEVFFSTTFVLLLGLGYYFSQKIPTKWIELNRKDGFVYVWSSRKKRKLVGKRHSDDIDIRYSKKWGSGYKNMPAGADYCIDLYGRSGKKKYAIEIDGKREVPFCTLFHLLTTQTFNHKNYDAATEGRIVKDNVEVFVRDFFAGKPVQFSKDNKVVITSTGPKL